MTRRRPRSGADLSPEDRALWREVTRGAVPLSPELRRAAGPSGKTDRPERSRNTDAAGDAIRDASAAAARPEPSLTDPAPFAGGPGERAAPNDTTAGAPRVLRPVGPPAPRAPGLDLAGPAVAPVGRPAPGLDRRTAERIRRGTRAPEARIDLHGMTAERAHRALDRCIAEALARGHRLVLVITGKGGRRESRGDVVGAPFARPGEGVLRREAPRWLRAGPHARDIVGIFEAHQRHGGAGAFYVYLKRRR